MSVYGVDIPTYNELLWPTLVAVRELGNTAKLDEIDERVVEADIDLIDGERLCELLREHRLGVDTTTRTIEEVRVRREFFENTG